MTIYKNLRAVIDADNAEKKLIRALVRRLEYGLKKDLKKFSFGGPPGVCILDGAQDRTRTGTDCPYAPQTYASANSATWACWYLNYSEILRTCQDRTLSLNFWLYHHVLPCKSHCVSGPIVHLLKNESSATGLISGPTGYTPAFNNGAIPRM